MVTIVTRQLSSQNGHYSTWHTIAVHVIYRLPLCDTQHTATTSKGRGHVPGLDGAARQQQHEGAVVRALVAGHVEGGIPLFEVQSAQAGQQPRRERGVGGRRRREESVGHESERWLAEARGGRERRYR